MSPLTSATAIPPVESFPPPPPKKVVFIGVQKGYLHTQDIIFDIDYHVSTTVSPKDWIAILPAGYTHLAHFAAFKTAPAKQVICGSKTGSEDGKNIVSDDCEESCSPPRPEDTNDANGNRPIRLVFRAKETRLPPRNFYQIVYVQGSSRTVIGSSTVFYVERALGKMPEAKHKMVVVHEDKFSACMLRNLFCGITSGVEATPKASETKSALLIEGDGEEDAVKTQQPLCDQGPGAYECIKRYITEVLRQPLGSGEPDRSASMYEIGSFNNSMNNNIESKSVHDHYQKLIAQLTMSNSSMHRENEMLKNQIQRMSMQLQDHIDHLGSVYYSMHKYGYTALELPDGERVNLAKYRGVTLNFVGGYSTPQYSPRSQFEIKDLNDLRDSISKRNGTINSEKEELKTAMLKCLTKSQKKSDVDDYVNWLNDNSTPKTPPKPLKQLQFIENVIAQGANDDRRSRQERPSSEETSKSVRFTPPADPTTSSTPENHVEPPKTSQKANGTAKAVKNGKTASSVSSSKSSGSGFAGAHKLSTGTKSSAPRRSLANLSYMRAASRSPRRNLI